jgi:hypothetical protein
MFNNYQLMGWHLSVSLIILNFAGTQKLEMTVGLRAFVRLINMKILHFQQRKV